MEQRLVLCDESPLSVLLHLAFRIRSENAYSTKVRVWSLLYLKRLGLEVKFWNIIVSILVTDKVLVFISLFLREPELQAIYLFYRSFGLIFRCVGKNFEKAM
jgi:hypothetical protein